MSAAQHFRSYRRLSLTTARCSQASVLVERMGNHRKPAHVRSKRTSKSRLRK